MIVHILMNESYRMTTVTLLFQSEDGYIGDDLIDDVEGFDTSGDEWTDDCQGEEGRGGGRLKIDLVNRRFTKMAKSEWMGNSNNSQAANHPSTQSA